MNRRSGTRVLMSVIVSVCMRVHVQGKKLAKMGSSKRLISGRTQGQRRLSAKDAFDAVAKKLKV